MKSRLDYVAPAGRRALLTFPQRLDPARPMGFPYEPVIAEPAQWPAGEDWQARRRAAAPLRAIVRGVSALVNRAVIGPLNRLATRIEGQPLVWWCEMAGWREKHGWRDQHPRTRWWVYEGEITPSIRQMFAEHPERFADCSDEMLAALRAGQ